MATKSKSKIQWFASGGDIAKCGPFKSQILAYQAMTLVPKYRSHPSIPIPLDCMVWPEYI